MKRHPVHHEVFVKMFSPQVWSNIHEAGRTSVLNGVTNQARSYAATLPGEPETIPAQVVTGRYGITYVHAHAIQYVITAEVRAVDTATVTLSYQPPVHTLAHDSDEPVTAETETVHVPPPRTFPWGFTIPGRVHHICAAHNILLERY